MATPRCVDLEKHSLALLAAKGDVVGGRAAASWAVFAYGKGNELKLMDSGAGGPEELAKCFQSGSVMYGLCRLPEATTGRPLIVLISWVGKDVSDSRRQACAGHLPAIRAFFKEACLVVSARRAEEVTQDGLQSRLALVPPREEGTLRPPAPLGDPQELVGSNYQKTNPALEILHSKRDSFWAQAEREEAERREQERRCAQEERRRWERWRMEEERRETAERERLIQEREQLVQEQRKQAARLEAEEHRQEGVHGDAAGTAPQHPHALQGPSWQRGRSASASGAPERSSPAGGWPGTPQRPLLRHQRSLTEAAFIFRRRDPPAASLPSATPQEAPLPSPRRPKPPPPTVSPKPLARAAAGGPEQRPLAPGPLPASSSSSSSSGTHVQARPSSSAPEVGDLPHTALPELAVLSLSEPGQPSSSSNGNATGGTQPTIASAPPLGCSPHPHSQHPCLASSAAGGLLLSTRPHPDNSTAPAPLDAVLEESPLPPGNPLVEGPRRGCMAVASPHEDEAALSPEKDPPVDPALPPPSAQAEPAPYSVHSGVARAVDAQTGGPEPRKA